MDGKHMAAPWSESWPRSGMTRSGELYPLPMLERHISATGGGLWHIPTPTSADVYTGNLESSQQSDDSMHSVSLPDFVGRWPTHTSTERSGTNPNTGKGEGLSKTAKMFPTPRAGKTTDEDEESWLARHAAGKVATPPLALAVRMLPTPRSNSAMAATITEGADPNRYRNLETVIKKSDPESVGGSLSPDWVSWLMGLPVGWTSLEPLPREEYLDWLHAQQDGTWWEIERGLPRVSTGIKDRVNRLKCLGNGIVPASLALFLSSR